ncbi:hypothetical protein DMB66_32310 [Actinoplanes sp. ATCC 53533]|nr:hypothetical protein DMB66_32310 [Actinoplanes sp. ATCC 53533]
MDWPESTRPLPSSAPSIADARHLEWFAERVGSTFAAGIVLHIGPRVFRLAERIVAVPIASLWALRMTD